MTDDISDITGRQAIGEDDDNFVEIRADWLKRAKNAETIEDVSAFLVSLRDDYAHGYGTIIHALFAAMLAAYSFVDKSPHGGITGYQAGVLGWMLVKKFMGVGDKDHARILNYSDILFPQNASRFMTIPKSVHVSLVKRAQEGLDEYETKTDEEQKFIADSVVEHWKKIAAGEVPFGLKLSDD